MHIIFYMLKKHLEQNLCNHRLSKDFLDMSTVHKRKEKINQAPSRLNTCTL